MGSTIAEDLTAERHPPRRGLVCALAVDGTARPYDLTTVAFGRTLPPTTSGKTQEYVSLFMQADGADVYFHFDTATSTGAAVAATTVAGGTLAPSDAATGVIRAGAIPVTFIIDRAKDQFLIVKTAGPDATLRFWAGSASTV